MSQLAPEERLRYSRQIILPQISDAGQAKLKASKVLLIGAGGLGSPNALYLAAAGIGTLGVLDFDSVDISNLHRQPLYHTEDVGKPKVEAAKVKIQSLNPNVDVRSHNAKLDSVNALDVISGYDVIIDGSDNLPTRYTVNKACILLGKPNVYGSVAGFEGQASFFLPKHGPCFRCLYPEPPPPGEVTSCGESGILGVLPGLIGMIQTTETVKYILGIGELLIGSLLRINALEMSFRKITIRQDPRCAVCGKHPSITEPIDAEPCCGPRNSSDISPIDLKSLIERGQSPALIDVREPDEYASGHIESSILIPLKQLLDHPQSLDQNRSYVLYCHSGHRSGRAVKILADMGFKNVRNLKGGIVAYSEVDPTAPKY